MEKSLSELTTIDVMRNIDFLIIPKRDKNIRILYDTYKTSEDTLNLISEENRQLFADYLLLEERKNCVRNLYRLSLEIVVKNFNGYVDNINNIVDELTKKDIWELIDTNLSIVKTMNIDSDLYWERVYKDKTKKKLKIGDEETYDINLDWKCMGMQEKIRELFEDSSYEGWIDEKMIKIVQPIAKYIYHLSLTKLLPIKDYSFDRDPNLMDFRMINYNKEECHHINLDIIGELYQLTYLSFEFKPPAMGGKYHSRYFDLSTLDMIHLANGLERLHNLTTFKIRNSRLNNKKMEILIEGFKFCPLKTIDFSYCQLNDECGYTLSKLFVNNLTLEKINLCGNYLCSPGISALSYGIQEFEGYLKDLNLSRNPINDTGLMFIARAINDREQIEVLNLCGIQITDKGCAVLPNILKHTILRDINLTALPIGEILGDEIINAIDMNQNILNCDADECDLTLEQELKLKILIKRNNYISENPYIDIDEITESKQDIPDQEVKKIKNKLYLKAMEMFDEQQKCLKVLTEHYKKILPVVNKNVIRHSVQAKKILAEVTTIVPVEKAGKIPRLSEYHKYSPNQDEAEIEFIKQCTLSHTTNYQYFDS